MSLCLIGQAVAAPLPGGAAPAPLPGGATKAPLPGILIFLSHGCDIVF